MLWIIGMTVWLLMNQDRLIQGASGG